MAKKVYDYKKIEEKWADEWFKSNLYKAEDFSKKNKKYILAEFPYPSGKNLHAGHMMRYTVPDVYSRYLRMKGNNVLFPMGWDAFGLPAELHAIKTGIHPALTTAEIIEHFKKSFIKMGYGVDWDREINTTDPNYYKWTQWIFLKFFEKGIAQYQEMPVWWAKELGVLADEEVLTNEKGEKVSERGGFSVERKLKRQWILKIPLYADKLLEGLDEVDWPEHIKNAQRNWIGKKTGINISYPIEGMKDVVTVFTTRPDTNFGATFIAISPEHSLVKKVINKSVEIQDYVKKSLEKSELERISEGRKKTGIFSGLYALNRLNDQKLPIWIADFVLPQFGTGAVVGVPGHDKRDFEFAQQFGLAIKRVISSHDGGQIITINDVYEGEGVVVNSGFLNGMNSVKARDKVSDFLEEKGWGEKTVHYNIRDWVFSRQRYWGEPIPLLHRKDGKIEAVKDGQLPVTLPEVDDFNPLPDGTSPIAKNEKWLKVVAEDGTEAEREVDTMPNWAGSSWYFLRFTDPKNSKEFASKKNMEYWLPVDHYFGGSEHTTLHLLYSRFWNSFLHDEGYVPVKEPYKKRTNGGLLLGPDGRKMSKSLGNTVDPIAVVEKYGADALRMYIAFIGPYTDTYPWNDDGVKATHKLLQTMYEYSDKVTLNEASENMKIAYNKLLKNVTAMYENIKMNTAVSEIFKFMNLLKQERQVNKDIWLGFLQIVAPLSPFVTEELWQKAHKYPDWTPKTSIHCSSWPVFDEACTKDKQIDIPVQINGKVRATQLVSSNDTQEEIIDKVTKNSRVIEVLGNTKPKNIIYIPNRIINIVT